MTGLEHLAQHASEIITASFVASSGSPEAHVLFVAGYALTHNLPLETMPQIMRYAHDQLPEDQKVQLLHNLGHHHRNNQFARNDFKDIVRFYGGKDVHRVLRDQLPKSSAIDSMTRMIEIHKETTLSEVNGALERSFADEQWLKIAQDIKVMAAYLRLFGPEIGWWVRLDEEQKSLLISQGRDLVKI